MKVLSFFLILPSFFQCIEASFNKMVKEEKYHLGDLVKSVEHLAKEKMKLFRELNRNRKKSNNDSMPDDIPEGMPLMQVKCHQQAFRKEIQSGNH